MRVNANFSRRAMVAPAEHEWTPSAQPGVERMMLDRLGGEHARATSLVRYEAGSSFPGHQHPGGEEILVLSGTFREGAVDYPAGWYLRNPPCSGHQPSSPDGAVIFVKLWQMAPTETEPLRIDTRDLARWRREHDREVCPLFLSRAEQTSLQRLTPGASLFDGRVDGAELLVLDGSLAEGDHHHERGGWIRLPAGALPRMRAGAQGVTVYLKTGHLGVQAGGT